MPELMDIIYICTRSFTAGDYTFEAGKVYGFTKEQLAEIPQQTLYTIYTNLMSGEYGTVETPEQIRGEYPNGALATCTEPVSVSVCVIENGEIISADVIESCTLDDLVVITQAVDDGKLTLESLVVEKIFVLKEFELRKNIFNLYQVKTITATEAEITALENDGFVEAASDRYEYGSFRALKSFSDAVTGISMIEMELASGYVSVYHAQSVAFQGLRNKGLIEYYTPPVHGAETDTLTLKVSSQSDANLAVANVIDASTDKLRCNNLIIKRGEYSIPVPFTNSSGYTYFVVKTIHTEFTVNSDSKNTNLISTFDDGKGTYAEHYALFMLTGSSPVLSITFE